MDLAPSSTSGSNGAVEALVAVFVDLGLRCSGELKEEDDGENDYGENERMTARSLFIDPWLEIHAEDLTVEAVSAHRWMLDTCPRSIVVKSHLR